MSEQIILTTGRRKEAVARVRVCPGEGKILVNGKDSDIYFTRERDRITIREPLKLTDNLKKYNILANVKGGGICGQAEALRHGIARALIILDPSLKPTLRQAGFLSRDPRMKERKKYGQKGARKRFQWTKR